MSFALLSFSTDEAAFSELITALATPPLPIPTAEVNRVVQVTMITGILTHTPTSAGTGLFVESKQALGKSSSAGVALGDLDGDLDAFVANCKGQANKVWLNGGR